MRTLWSLAFLLSGSLAVDQPRDAAVELAPQVIGTSASPQRHLELVPLAHRYSGLARRQLGVRSDS